MKTIINLSTFFGILLLFFQLNSNPIAMPFITELKPDSSDFSIEIHGFWWSSFDGCYLTSLSDTVAIDSGITLMDSNYNIINEYVVLTQDSLMSVFSFDVHTDEIGLGFYQTMKDSVIVFEAFESICYGDTNDSVIGSPRLSQSICLNEDSGGRYYFDNTPTLGLKNDENGAIGYLDGFVLDSSGNPLSNYLFKYSYNDNRQYKYYSYRVTTDENGYYLIESLASRLYLAFEKDQMLCKLIRQIYPDDTLHTNIYYNQLVDIEKPSEHLAIIDFELNQNYPNPFNPQTNIGFYLPQSEDVEIAIYDILGRKVKTLLSGRVGSGSHTAIWNGTNDSGLRCASGIYYYRLRVGEFAEMKKMLLVE